MLGRIDADDEAAVGREPEAEGRCLQKKGDDDEHDEDDQQDLGRPRREASDASEAEQGRDEGDDGKHDDGFEHGAPPSGGWG